MSCHLCAMGDRIADCLKTAESRMGPADALHVLGAAITNIINSADWRGDIGTIVEDVVLQIRTGVGLLGPADGTRH